MLGGDRVDTLQKQMGKWFSVDISDQGMEAYITLISAPDPIVSSSDLKRFIQHKGIVYGIDDEILECILSDPEFYLTKKIPIACGKPPQNGDDGFVKFVYMKENMDKGPVLLEDGTVDYYNVKTLDNILKGQRLAEKIPPTQANPGISVLGVEIAGKDGKPAQFKIGKNVVVDEAQNHLYAVIDGLVATTDGGKLNVFTIYEVPGDVDFHVGNIDFVGTVVIRGNVLPGFRIKASGDIRVLGNVEGADLESGGWIEVGSGIVGHHKCTIRAGTDVRTSYIHTADVEAKENVIVSHSVMHSHVKAGKTIVCNGAKGLIVGGHVQAGEMVESRNIGNMMSTPTIIEVGVLPEVREKWAMLRQHIKELQENKIKTDQGINLLTQMEKKLGKLPADKQMMFDKIKAVQSQQDFQIYETGQQLSELNHQLESESKGIISVHGTIYGSCKLVIGRKTIFTLEPKTRVKYMVQEQDISSLPL
jgi:uncharacterized protein (DUF342 family)